MKDRLINKNPIRRHDILEIYTDGASRGNPGPAAWAYIFVRDGEIIYQNSEYIGEATNNTAEYIAIIKAIQEAQKYTRWTIKVYSDSELVIKQINKDYRIKKEHLSELCEKVSSLCHKFEKVEFFNVGRENRYIKICDKMCEECLNRFKVKSKK